MTTERFESIWFLINQYDFKFDVNRYNDLICGMCKKLLSEAMQSACCCKFCRRCIEIYLVSNCHTCPGPSELCQSTILDFSEDVIIDHTTNKRISLLKVKCPFDQCTFEDKLINMEAHINVCNKAEFHQQPELSLENREMINEMQINEVIHLKLLIESIDNLRNENEVLTSEINSLKRIQISTEKFQSQIDEMNVKIDEIITNQRDLSKKLESNFYGKPSDSKCRINKNQSGKLENKKNVLRSQNNFGEIIWKIDNFVFMKHNLKIGNDQWLDSDTFYSSPNHYKLQIRLWIEEPNVDIMILMISGDLPVAIEITVGILHPENGNYEVSEKKLFEYFSRSCTSKAYFHFPNSSVLNLAMQYDSLVVRCLAKDLKIKKY